MLFGMNLRVKLMSCIKKDLEVFVMNGGEVDIMKL